MFEEKKEINRPTREDVEVACIVAAIGSNATKAEGLCMLMGFSTAHASSLAGLLTGAWSKWFQVASDGKFTATPEGQDLWQSVVNS